MQVCFAASSLGELRRQLGDKYLEYNVIAIDEAQFLPDLLEFCTAAADLDHKHIVIAGLDGDFKRQRFGQVSLHLPLRRDHLTACRAFYCSRLATKARGHRTYMQGVCSHICEAYNTLCQAVVRGASIFQDLCRTRSLTGCLTDMQVLDMVSVADSVTKLAGKCAYCSEQALFSLRIAADERQALVGGADKYAPVCRQHYVSLSNVRTPEP